LPPLEFKPKEPEAPVIVDNSVSPPGPLVGKIVMGLGGASAVVGAVLLGVASSQRSSIGARVDANGNIPFADQGLVSSTKNMQERGRRAARLRHRHCCGGRSDLVDVAGQWACGDDGSDARWGGGHVSRGAALSKRVVVALVGLVLGCGVPGSRACKTSDQCTAGVCIDGLCYTTDGGDFDGGTGGGSATGGGSGGSAAGGGVAGVVEAEGAAPWRSRA